MLSLDPPKWSDNLLFMAHIHLTLLDNLAQDLRQADSH